MEPPSNCRLHLAAGTTADFSTLACKVDSLYPHPSWTVREISTVLPIAAGEMESVRFSN